MKKKIFRVIAGVFILMAVYFFQQGFDKKDSYYNAEYYPELNKNVYVGGDAYNFIINGTYFTGYLVIGSAMIISGMISLLISESTFTQINTPEDNLKRKEETIKEVSEELPEI